MFVPVCSEVFIVPAAAILVVAKVNLWMCLRTAAVFVIWITIAASSTGTAQLGRFEVFVIIVSAIFKIVASVMADLGESSCLPEESRNVYYGKTSVRTVFTVATMAVTWIISVGVAG